MTDKYISIEFAKQNYRAIDYIQDIREASKHAGLNLYSRYGVQLQYPMAFNDRVIVEVRIPDEIASDFVVGKHLRGISDFLMKKHGDAYKNMRLGKRLFNYIEVSDPNASTNLSEFEKLDLINALVQFLQSNDDEVALVVKKIRTILADRIT